MRDFTVLMIAAMLAAPAIAQHNPAGHGAGPAAQHPAAREWTRLPVLAPPMSRGGERAAAVLRPLGIEAAEVIVFAAGGPDERRRVAYPVVDGGARIEAAAPKVGNYHWVLARQELETEVRVASTARYFSNPGPAPTELLKVAKHELEIVPQPLPREHSRYREAEEWRFQVRWNGAPAAKQKVVLETEYGSRSTYVSDGDGMIVALFPRDFRELDGRPDADQHMSGPQTAMFVLGTQRDEGGKHYVTAFNHTYSAAPERTHSLGWGATFGLIGMVAALPLLRRRTATADFPEKKNA